MTLRVFKEGELVAKYSAVTGKADFNEKNERTKPVTLYNIQNEKRGLSDDDH
jgi:hypothetical protein